MSKLNTSKCFLLLLIGLAPFCILQAAESELPKVKATILKGSKLQICKDVAKVLETHGASFVSYCGTPIPSDSPDYKLAEWEALDPTKNIELVKTIYYWIVLNKSVGQEVFDRQNRDKTHLDPELVALFWPKAESQIMDLIAKGAIELSHSRFDIDNDGVAEDVYRMTPLGRDRNAAPPQEQETHKVVYGGQCQDFGLPGEKKRYTYYVPPDQLPAKQELLTANPMGMNSFFKLKGRVYWERTGAIFRTVKW